MKNVAAEKQYKLIDVLKAIGVLIDAGIVVDKKMVDSLMRHYNLSERKDILELEWLVIDDQVC